MLHVELEHDGDFGQSLLLALQQALLRMATIRICSREEYARDRRHDMPDQVDISNFRIRAATHVGSRQPVRMCLADRTRGLLFGVGSDRIRSIRTYRSKRFQRYIVGIGYVP